MLSLLAVKIWPDVINTPNLYTANCYLLECINAKTNNFPRSASVSWFPLIVEDYSSVGNQSSSRLSFTHESVLE